MIFCAGFKTATLLQMINVTKTTVPPMDCFGCILTQRKSSGHSCDHATVSVGTQHTEQEMCSERKRPAGCHSHRFKPLSNAKL